MKLIDGMTTWSTGQKRSAVTDSRAKIKAPLGAFIVFILQWRLMRGSEAISHLHTGQPDITAGLSGERPHHARLCIVRDVWTWLRDIRFLPAM